MRVDAMFLVIGILLILTGSIGAQPVAITNNSFQNGDLSGWTTFKINGGTPAVDVAFRTTAPPPGSPTLQDPVDGKAAGTDAGTNQSGWRTGLYQVVTVMPGRETTLSVTGQIYSFDVGGHASTGDDILSFFWVDSATADFTTTWPGSAQVLGTIASQTTTWTALSGTVTPTGSQIIIGTTAYFTDPEWDYDGCQHIVDDFSGSQAQDASSAGNWMLYR